MHWMQHRKYQFSAKYHFWKNQEKNSQNDKNNGQNEKKKNTILAVFVVEFSEIILRRELRFFALHSVHQNPFFELSKSTFRQFFWFFTLRGVPCDFGVVKSYTKLKKWVNKIPPKKSKILDQIEQENGWYKFLSSQLTSGAFGGTLRAECQNFTAS